MALKDIIVYLDGEPGCTARLMAAIDLARRHGACLKGLHAVSHPFYAPQRDFEHDYSKERDFFLGAASKSGVKAEWLYVDWGVVGVSLSEIIAFHACSTDLLIIGQPGKDARSKREGLELPERLILGSGRPVVVFPRDSDIFQFGDKVLVAWRGGREATRAIHDALPLLKGSSRIDIVSVVSGEEERQREQISLMAVDVYLARHAIEARTATIDGKGRSVADLILERIREEGSDLLVMGGFSYNARGIPIFNKLARELMAHMTVPILLSH
jgi:nucleotide-binding universal stress UspA family protein